MQFSRFLLEDAGLSLAPLLIKVAIGTLLIAFQIVVTSIRVLIQPVK